MTNYEKRLAALEVRVRAANGLRGVAVLLEESDGWRLAIGGRTRLFDSEREARGTIPDAVHTIIIDL